MPGINEPQNLGPPQITSIVSFSKGFACSCGPGTVAWFEKTDDKEYFKKVSVFVFVIFYKTSCQVLNYLLTHTTHYF